MGASQDRPFPHILSLSSSLKYLKDSIWCRFSELFYRYLSLTHTPQMEDVNYLMTMSTEPQASWNLRIDKVKPCDTTLLPHHQPTKELCKIYLIMYLATFPSLIWLLKMLCLKPFRELGIFKAWVTHLLAWPCNKPSSAPNSEILVVWPHCMSGKLVLTLGYSLIILLQSVITLRSLLQSVITLRSLLQSVITLRKLQCGLKESYISQNLLLLLLLLSRSVVSDSVRPHRWQPTRLPRPRDSPGTNTGVGCHFLLQCMKVNSEREVAQSCPTLSDPMDCSPPDFSIHGIFQAKAIYLLGTK